MALIVLIADRTPAQIIQRRDRGAGKHPMSQRTLASGRAPLRDLATRGDKPQTSDLVGDMNRVIDFPEQHLVAAHPRKQHIDAMGTQQRFIFAENRPHGVESARLVDGPVG